MPEISLQYLIKPASGLCNMRCRYCFYTDEMNKRAQASYGIMTEATAEALVKGAFAAAPARAAFAFQGGEPTLAGLPFFEKFCALVREYNTKRIPVELALQTNGYALDEAWAAFLAKEGFLVGISVDGWQELHDANRIDAAGEGTYGRVCRAARLLDRWKVPYNVLTVVTAQAARHPDKIYGSLRRNGFGYWQFIPCLDPLGEARGGEKYSLTPEGYGSFLCRIFDLWYADLTCGRQPYIRYFENLVAMLVGRPPEACGMLGHCSRQLVVEADGRVYPCDFYVLDGYAIGSVCTDSVAQIEQKRALLGFIEQSAAVAPECAACRFYPICRGGCRRDRDDGCGTLGKSWFCGAYQAFFTHALPRLEQIASVLERQGRV